VGKAAEQGWCKCKSLLYFWTSVWRSPVEEKIEVVATFFELLPPMFIE
jgi:hypothetical protein